MENILCFKKILISNLMKRTFVLISIIFSISLHAQIPTDSLKAHYEFNNNLNDLSGNSNHIVSASGSYSTDRFGQLGNAYSFNGVTDSLVIPVNEFGPTQNDFTISFWYKTNSSDVMNLFSSKQFSNDTTSNFEIQLNSHNSFYLEFLKQSWYQTFVYWNGSGFGTNSVAEGGPGFFTKGDWCHFLLERTGDTFAIYRNHVPYTLSLDNTFGGVLGDLTNFIFSASPYRFKGSIDDLRLYNKALSPTEIDLLWFENNPIKFISPKTTDAYVQNSNPLIYWEYNDFVLSDSINVEMSINNGSWQIYLPHSHMAYENAFYFNLSAYPTGTLIEFKVTDVSDTNIVQTSGIFAISPYNWVEVQNSLPFTSRDGSGLLNFQNKLWLLGGWDPPNNPPNNTQNEVWSSYDGANWSFEGNAPWPARHCSAWITDSVNMYVIGGDPQSGCLTDVWKTADGVTWNLLVDTIPAFAKRNNSNYAFANDKLFMFGGEECGGGGLNEVWESPDGISWTQLPDAPWSGRGMQINSCVDDSGQIWMLGGSNESDRRSFNEVWKTNDGINWTLVNEAAPWAGRYWHTTAWFDNKLWVVAGMATANEVNDVWYSEVGIIWNELKSTTGNWPAGTRHAQSTSVYNNALWYMCGISTNNSWKIINTTSSIGITSPSENSNPFTIFPNPSNSIINIVSQNQLPVGLYSIYNSIGSLVLQGNLLENQKEINVSSLPTGFYTITIGNNNSSHKLIKY